jgi:hypothetical protein
MYCRVIINHLLEQSLDGKGLELEQMNAGAGEQVGESFLTV